MAAVSSVTIANMALSHIGAKSSIESLDENSSEAKQCKLWYAFSLEQALESYDWSFARTRRALALSGEAPPDQWSYRYQYPADCVKARRIWNPAGEQADAVPFEIEMGADDNRTILTDIQGAVLIFTKSVTNPALFSKLFVEMLSRGLAQHIAFALTGKTEVTKEQAGAYQSILRAAAAYDGNERVGQPPRDAEWIRGRTFDPNSFNRRF